MTLCGISCTLAPGPARLGVCVRALLVAGFSGPGVKGAATAASTVFLASRMS